MGVFLYLIQVICYGYSIEMFHCEDSLSTNSTFLDKKMDKKIITIFFRPLVKSMYPKIIFLNSQPKHVVGTQKNCLNKTVLLST